MHSTRTLFCAGCLFLLSGIDTLAADARGGFALPSDQDSLETAPTKVPPASNIPAQNRGNVTLPAQGQPPGTGRSSLPATSKPLQGRLVSTKVLRDSVMICKALPPALDDARNRYKSALFHSKSYLSAKGPVEFSAQPGSSNSSLANTLDMLETRVEACCVNEKSFSLQEQQAAGCTGNDTVNICMEKLTTQCIKKGMPASAALRSRIQTISNNTRKSSNSLKHLSDGLEHLANIIPIK